MFKALSTTSNTIANTLELVNDGVKLARMQVRSTAADEMLEYKDKLTKLELEDSDIQKFLSSFDVQ